MEPGEHVREDRGGALVPVSDLSAVLLDDARQALLREITPAAGRNDLHEAFAAWLLPGVVPGLGIDGPAEVAVEAEGAERRFDHVAVLGLAAQARGLSDREREALASGVRWMVDRAPVIGGTPMSFSMDGVALAAILLGARVLGDDALWADTCEWLRRCRAATAVGQGLGVWQEWLLAEVSCYTGADWPRKANDGPEAAAVRAALRSRGVFLGEPSPAEADEAEALRVIRAPMASGIGAPLAAIRLAALDWIRRDRPVCDVRQVSVEDVGALLRRVPFGLKKWTWESAPRTKTSPEPRRWHVENEYHVQNMLWLILAPLFPDLIDEDATPKVGPVQPRADICVPSLRLVIEVKFMRGGDQPKKMVEQIATDASLYLVPGSKYDRVIPFVWDDSRRSERHGEMIRGMRQISGVADAVIVSRPGCMEPAAGD
jgi:hypothetical protein